VRLGFGQDLIGLSCVYFLTQAARDQLAQRGVRQV
jgi:hypothetical protein